MNYRSTSLTETQKLAETFIKSLQPQKKATIVALHGDLGAGKTTFTQSVAKALGITETVTSPTFVIEKIYHVKPEAGNVASSFSKLIHIDAYRLESGKELAKLNWQEISEDPKNLIFIEWPEKVADILPTDIKKLEFTFVDENTREIQI